MRIPVGTAATRFELLYTRRSLVILHFVIFSFCSSSSLSCSYGGHLSPFDLSGNGSFCCYAGGNIGSSCVNSIVAAFATTNDKGGTSISAKVVRCSLFHINIPSKITSSQLQEHAEVDCQSHLGKMSINKSSQIISIWWLTIC